MPSQNPSHETSNGKAANTNHVWFSPEQNALFPEKTSRKTGLAMFMFPRIK
jgi:hypothetical protein